MRQPIWALFRRAPRFKRVSSYIAEGLQRRPSVQSLTASRTFHLAWMVITSVRRSLPSADNRWRLAQEEDVRAVLVAIPWRTEAEVIAMANDCHYGLAAFLWCHDLDRVLNAYRRIESGWIQVNQGGGSPSAGPTAG